MSILLWYAMFQEAWTPGFSYYTTIQNSIRLDNQGGVWALITMRALVSPPRNADHWTASDRKFMNCEDSRVWSRSEIVYSALSATEMVYTRIQYLPRPVDWLSPPKYSGPFPIIAFRQYLMTSIFYSRPREGDTGDTLEIYLSWSPRARGRWGQPDFYFWWSKAILMEGDASTVKGLGISA